MIFFVVRTILFLLFAVLTMPIGIVSETYSKWLREKLNAKAKEVDEIADSIGIPIDDQTWRH